MYVVAEGILVILLSSARGREAARATCRECAGAACVGHMCKSTMSTDYQAVVAGQVGKWGVAVRMLTRPADQIQGKPAS